MTYTQLQPRTFDKAQEAVVQKACLSIGWDYAEAWMPDSSGTRIEYSPIWYRRSEVQELLAKFHSYSQKVRFLSSVGIPGHIRVSKQAEWEKDISGLPETVARQPKKTTEVSLKSAFEILILANNIVATVIIFYSREIPEYDRYLVCLIFTFSNLSTLISNLLIPK